ncbi:pectinesterase [Mucilaginibacter robiniae]|uniref:Pectinesterase n=1 Tax=Mucilaginibacter robiniae TaxID=2728022 RepID=A0A7L5DZ87_9SPHI|nr:pectinesterase family protein [Mucilaginibacter robiniae]QJD94594.1 pectinesterase [Mucilaginibacter robiniae]
MKRLFAIGINCLLALACCTGMAQSRPVIVDAAGKGDFKAIQEAINSLPDSSATNRTILVKKGTYPEKISITKSHIILKGEDEAHTVITFDMARDVWRCQNHADDWGVATLNLRGSDITLENLTIINGYGFHHVQDSTINCQSNTESTTTKVVRPDGHQMALRSFQTTRLRVIHCALRARGGDTVSPWNGASGLYYFKDCLMEGGVDFYCPRGWAYAENCQFVCHSLEAAIWHDGSKNKSQKTVLVNCTFTGDSRFKLGRYHLDSQFYLINCKFARNMANAPIYQAASSKGTQWGSRIYFENCHRDGGDYTWFKNNLATAPGAPVAANINALWAMDNQWNPERSGE